ncbi:SDR family oxidoreductase [Nocardioides sp. CN2-186]|uniref:SDR family oxidoreductase n=1 Tax=Nocardioides tweenelious TaxID=3156607 RepID=UPI0032B4DFC2
MTKIWYITGTSRGLGREFAINALERGDRVAATARDVTSLDDLVATYGDALLPLALDVTDKAAVEASIAQTHERFGRLDIVVNNAGYGHFGAVEELTESEIRDQMETNFFGALWVVQAALPILRAQGSGHIVQISTIGGIGAFPNIGAYHASKWALEGMSEALAQEVGPLGIHVTLVEPGGFSTDWAGDSSKRSAPMDVYEPVREAMAARRGAQKPGNPVTAGQAILDVVDADEPPLRVLFGSGPTEMVKAIYASRLATWDEWSWISHKAQG